jgi:LacI family transcriptional regulator
VFLNRYVGGVAADRAIADNHGGAVAVAELLLRLGHQDIGLIMGPADTSTTRDRERGFREHLSAAGIELQPVRIAHGGLKHDDGVQGFAKITSGQPPPTAIFCVNDFVAVGAYNAALTAGLRIPDDLAIVGFDDVSMAAWPAFELTTVNVPVAEMARAATQLLIARIRGEGPERPRHQTFPTSLVLRRSHGQPLER